MKSSVITMLAICLAVPAFAQLKGAPEKVAEAKQKGVSAMESFGGFVIKDAPKSDAKSLTFVDNRTKKDEIPAQFAERMMLIFHVYSRVGEPKEGDAVVELCDIGTESVVYPDKAFARIPTGKDDAETRKQLHAGVMYVLGVKGANLSPQSAKSMLKNATDIGIPIVKRSTYQAAVMEGWAPAPTNDIQKAIWEKVKAEKEAKAKAEAPKAEEKPAEAPAK